MECYGCLRNVQDLVFDAKTQHNIRFGEPFDGPMIPFGSLVEYHAISAKDPINLVNRPGCPTEAFGSCVTLVWSPLRSEAQLLT